MSWSREKIETLIDLYQEREFLYNTSAKEYHNKQKREIAIKQIAAVLDMTDEEIKKKIIGLRTQYSAEHKKVISTFKSGAGSDDIYRPRWTFYDKLHFLAEHITPRRTLSNFEIYIDTDEAEAHNSTETIQKTANSTRPPVGKKRSIRDEEDLVLKEASESLKDLQEQSQISRCDEHDLFCKYLAGQLRSIKNVANARYAHFKIMNVLHEILLAENQPPVLNLSAPGRGLQTIPTPRPRFLGYTSKTPSLSKPALKAQLH